MTAPVCPYCRSPSRRVTGRDLYPHRADLYEKSFYACLPCKAWVGCHRDGAPLGRLANAELRRAKMRAHAAFDPLWRSGRLKRTHAYAWLSQEMGLPPEETHIGMFDEAQCARVVLLCTGRADK